MRNIDLGVLYGTVFAVGILLGTVTLVTESDIGIVVLVLIFIIMSCAEIYWWAKYQEAKEQLEQEEYNGAT